MRLTYDKGADVLYVTFRRSKHVTCLEGTGYVLTRIDPETKTVVGFTVLHLREVLQHLPQVELPYIEDADARDKLLEVIRDSAKELLRCGRKSFYYNPRFGFTPKMAQELGV